MERSPGKKWTVCGNVPVYGLNGALRRPGCVVQFLRQIPMVLTAYFFIAGRPALKIVAPLGKAMLLHPDRIVLPDMRLIGMHPSGFNILKAIPWTMKRTPEIEVAQNRLALNGLDSRPGCQRLEVRFPNQRSFIAVLLKNLADGGHIFRKFSPEVPAAMPRRIHARNYRRPRRRADRTVAICPSKMRPFVSQSIQIRSLNARVDNA